MPLQLNLALGALLLPNGQVLVKRLSALDGRRIGAHDLIDIVRRAIRLHGALVRPRGPRVVRAVRLDHVVLDERAGGPAVEREQAVAGCGEGAGVGYVAVRREGV